jgi:hypothetical protein
LCAARRGSISGGENTALVRPVEEFAATGLVDFFHDSIAVEVGLMEECEHSRRREPKWRSVKRRWERGLR